MVVDRQVRMAPILGEDKMTEQRRMPGKDMENESHPFGNEMRDTIRKSRKEKSVVRRRIVRHDYVGSSASHLHQRVDAGLANT
jgi:hypothetical protein